MGTLKGTKSPRALKELPSLKMGTPKGLERPFEGPYNALKGLLRVEGPYKALNGLVRPLRAV